MSRWRNAATLLSTSICALRTRSNASQGDACSQENETSEAPMILKLILPVASIVLMTAGFLIQKRNRSPYGGGNPMEAKSLVSYERGEAIFFVGSVCFLIDLVFVRG